MIVKTWFFSATLVGFIVTGCGGPDFQAAATPVPSASSSTSGPSATTSTGATSTTSGSGVSTVGSTTTTVGTGGTTGAGGSGGAGGTTVEIDAGVLDSAAPDSGMQPEAQVPAPDTGGTIDSAPSSDAGTADSKPTTCTTIDKGYETVKTCTDGTSTTTPCDGRVYVHWTVPNAVTASLTVGPKTTTMQTCHPEYVVNTITASSYRLHDTGYDCTGAGWCTYCPGRVFVISPPGALNCDAVPTFDGENFMLAIGFNP